MSQKMIRILLVEDHRILREGLRAILNAQPELAVVGEASEGGEAISHARELQPDVVLLDLSMPRMNGLEAIKGIKRVAAGVRVIILSVHQDGEYVQGALSAGADGYLTKDSSAEELVTGVRSVATGACYLCQAVVDRLDPIGNGRLSHANGQNGNLLTPREREVLKLVAEGYRSRQVAEYLCISEKTVEKHRASLMHKLRATNVSGLTAYAIEHGLISH
jgi:two-component system, NarL family, response regulator NreC